MASLNKAILIGNIVRDAELKMTPGGQPVANFSVATTEKWTANGEKKEKTEFHSISCFGKQAEIAEKYVKKGGQICVEGSIQYRDAESNGVKKTYTSINCKNFVLLGGKKADDAPKPGNVKVVDDEDIPW